MLRSSSRAVLAIVLFGAMAWAGTVSVVQAQTSVLNYHYDHGSTGQNLAEKKLHPSSIRSSNFGKIFSKPVNGQVYAQPLYVPKLPITAGSSAGTTHDTIFVCTQHDSVYALDATNGATLWTHGLLASGETTEPATDSGTADINPEIGVTGTPVIDATADATTKKRYLYVVAKSRHIIGGLPHYFFKLHAIDIASGAERGGSPVVIAETTFKPATKAYTYNRGPAVIGTGSGQVDGKVPFNAMREHQRPGLTLSQGRIYIAFASHGDSGPYHGWVLGYNAATLAPSAVFNVSPDGYNGGIWMAGGSVAADPEGALYVVTGNGLFANANAEVEPVPADFDAEGFPRNHCYGDSLIKLVVDDSTPDTPNPNGWGLKVEDYFTPHNQKTLNLGDTDYGSGGVLVCPDSAGSAAHPHLLVSAGKEGRIYLVDRDNMGKFRGGITGKDGQAAFVSQGDKIVQASEPNTIFGSLDTPAYFNGRIYYAGAYNADTAKAFPLVNGVLKFKPSSVTADDFGYLGSTPAISASGSKTNGVVWCVDRGSNQLRAYDANDLSNQLYNSGEALGARDQLGTAVKFGVATVADGRVIIGTSEPAGPSAVVCYGVFDAATTPPAQPQNLYAQAVSGGEIQLFWDDYANNESGYQVYVSTDPNNFPTTPAATTDVDGSSAIINGLQANTTYYLRVRSFNEVGESAFSNIAAVTSGDAPRTDFSNGFTHAANLVTGAGYETGLTPIVGAVLRLSDGGTMQRHAVWLNTVQNIGTFATEFTFQATKAVGDGFTFCVQNQGPTAVGDIGNGLGYRYISRSAAVKFNLYPSVSTTGLYLNGVSPDDSPAATANSSGSIDVRGAGIDFHSEHKFRVILNYDGATLTEKITDTVTQLTFTHVYPLNLASVLGGSKAYVGFTAGTGGVSAQQDIQSWSFSTEPATAPAAPSVLGAVAGSATQVNLTWTDNSTNETSFRVERAAVGGAFEVIGSVGANVTAYVDPNLTPNTTYLYRVTASDYGVDSPVSEVVTITTPVPPTTPSAATPTLVAANEIDFTWQDNSNNELGFRILRAAGSSEFKILAELPANTTSFKDTTVVPSTSYGYHIQAFNAAGYVDFTGFNTMTPAAVNIVASAATTRVGSSVPASFAIRRTTADKKPLTVQYTISTATGEAKYGQRYTLSPAPASTTTLTGSVTIPANTTAATVVIKPTAKDKKAVGSQNVTLTLKPGKAYTAQGSGSASVTILDTPENEARLAASKRAEGGESKAVTGDTADPDHDGLSNLMEYALGSNPSGDSSKRQPQVAIENVDGAKYLTLTYDTSKPLPGDIEYRPQFTTNASSGTWQPAVLVAGYPIEHGTMQTWKYRAPLPLTEKLPAGYMRLQVVRP